MKSIFKYVAAGVATGVVLTGILASGSVNAQQGPRGMAACQADRATFCGGIEAGRGKLLACLISNQDKLQPDCSAMVTARLSTRGDGPGRPAGRAGGTAEPGQGNLAQAPAQSEPAAGVDAQSQGRRGGGRGRGAMVACRGDAQTLCSAEARGGDRMRCLRENQAKLTEPCAQAIAGRQADQSNRRLLVRQACKVDADALCANDRGKQRRACLQTNQDKLSPACAAAVATMKPLPEGATAPKAN